MIKEKDISKYSILELNNLFFHFSSKNNYEIFNIEGIKPQIGKNSAGIDKEKSIFFSKGIEGVLKLWDVWLKWRYNRLFNPFRQQIYDNEKQNKYYKKFITKEFLNDDVELEKLFQYQYDEMCNCNYYLLNLKEDEFTYNQIDIKKQEIRNNKNAFSMVKVMYGDYSNLESDIMDDWNMQTKPGYDITITPNRIIKINIENKEDVYSIVSYLYYKYKNEIPINLQTKFDILDKYINYIEKLKKESIKQR